MTLTNLRTKIFGDGAELDGMLALYRQPHIKGFTTNPTLMRKAGITDYRRFAQQVLAAIPDRPISFESSPTIRRHGATGARDRFLGPARA
jgi:transaldolase